MHSKTVFLGELTRKELAKAISSGKGRCCMARTECNPRLGTRRHATIFADSGMPSAVIRLMILTAISASFSWASRC